MPGPGFGAGTFGQPRLILRDEGVGLPRKSFVNFIGAGVTASDNAASGETNVVIPGASGAQTVTRRTVVPPYTVATDDYALDVNGGGTITLPAATDGRVLRVKRVSVGADVVLSPSSGTIDGSSSYTLVVKDHAVDLVGDGTGWGLR